MEWIEDSILSEKSPLPESALAALEVSDIDLFKGHKDETLTDLEAALERRTLARDEKVYAYGDPGNELVPDPQGGGSHHLAEQRPGRRSSLVDLWTR